MSGIFEDLLQGGQPVATTDLGIQEAVLIAVVDVLSEAGVQFSAKIHALERELLAAGRRVCVAWVPSEKCLVRCRHVCAREFHCAPHTNLCCVDSIVLLLITQISEKEYSQFVMAHPTWLSYPYASLTSSSRALRARIPLPSGNEQGLAASDGIGQVYLTRLPSALSSLSVSTFPWRDAAVPQGLEPKWAQLGAIIGLFAMWVAIGASVL